MSKFEWQEGGQTFSEPMACESCERLYSENKRLKRAMSRCGGICGLEYNREENHLERVQTRRATDD